MPAPFDGLTFSGRMSPLKGSIPCDKVSL
jgi:hypothetical protein